MGSIKKKLEECDLSAALYESALALKPPLSVALQIHLWLIGLYLKMKNTEWAMEKWNWLMKIIEELMIRPSSSEKEIIEKTLKDMNKLVIKYSLD